MVKSSVPMTRTLIGLILVLALFAGGGTIGWYFVKDKIRSKQEYRLSADKVIVSPPPNWVPEQFVEDVLRSAGLNQTDFLLDKTLPQKLAEAFAAYPWIERVEQVVLRYPSGADVELVYRVPVALVEIPQRRVMPVDKNGIVLPPEYLAKADSDWKNKHWFVQGIQSMPLGSFGTPWGDPLVHMASQLAAALTDDPDNTADGVKLTRSIIATTENIPGGSRIVCRLQTAAGMEIHWGTFVPDDPKFESKKKRLWNLHEQFGSLDNVPAHFRPIDLSRE